MSADANERRINEGNECVRRAEEHLKTSLLKLKTKPNFDSAAYEYERAAVCFRNAGRLELCRDTYIKSAECHASNKNLFHEAKGREAAAMAAKDAKDLDGAVELFEQSAEGYLLSGSADTASMTIDKAAKIVEPLDIDKAIRLYERGLIVVQQADRAKMAGSFLNRLIALYIRQAKWHEALEKGLELIAKCEEIGETGKVGQVVMGMALVELMKGDSVAALQSLRHLPESNAISFAHEISAVKCLVKAYDEGDDDAFQKCLAGGLWRSMDNEYLRLMKKMKAPEGVGAGAGAGEDEDEEDLR